MYNGIFGANTLGAAEQDASSQSDIDAVSQQRTITAPIQSSTSSQTNYSMPTWRYPTVKPTPLPTTTSPGTKLLLALTRAGVTSPIVTSPVPMPGITTDQPSTDDVIPMPLLDAGTPIDETPAASEELPVTTAMDKNVQLPTSLATVREQRVWKDVTYYGLPQQQADTLLGVVLLVDTMGGFELVGEGELVELGDKSTSIVGRAKTTASTSEDPAQGVTLPVPIIGPFINDAKANGFGVIVEKSGENDFKLWKTRNINVAANVTTTNPESAVLVEPSAGWLKPTLLNKNTLMIGAAVLAGAAAIGGLVWYMGKHPKPMKANKRRTRKRARSHAHRQYGHSY
jgi:hypothetical protein